MRWREDHTTRQLDGGRVYLTNEIGAGFELIDCSSCGGFEVGERINKDARVENYPLITVLRLELISHSIERSNVVSQHGHHVIPYSDELITTQQMPKGRCEGRTSRQWIG